MQDTPQIGELLAPYRLEVHDMLCSGWSPARVYRHLEVVRHVKVPLQEIIQFLATIPETELLPKTVLQQHFQDADIEVDALGEMARLLRLQSERLGTALLLETAVGERVPYVELASKVYWTMLQEYVAMKQAVGDFPVPGSLLATTDDNKQQPLPQLRDLFIINNATMLTPAEQGAIIDGVVKEQDYPGGPQAYTRAKTRELVSG
jgi:hypothetical protein